MTSNIGREVLIAAKKGVVIGEKSAARGKLLLTVKMTDGREMVVNACGVEFTAEFNSSFGYGDRDPRREAMLKRCGGDATLLRTCFRRA